MRKGNIAHGGELFGERHTSRRGAISSLRTQGKGAVHALLQRKFGGSMARGLLPWGQEQTLLPLHSSTHGWGRATGGEAGRRHGWAALGARREGWPRGVRSQIGTSDCARQVLARRVRRGHDLTGGQGSVKLRDIALRRGKDRVKGKLKVA
jgi:hypothetical protein